MRLPAGFAKFKSEYQNKKYETNTNNQKAKIQSSFGYFTICILKIVSGFVLRISNFQAFGIALLFLIFAATPALAQTTNASSASATPINNFAAPNMDPNVPLNQHTYAQAVTIEVLSAVMCQLTGVDPVNPGSSCLGINPQTNKLGYAPTTSPENQTKLGGLLGATTGMIAYTFKPAASGDVYNQYLSENFGIVKKSYAAPPPGPGYGFEGLKPIFGLWIAVRNIAYSLLIIAFIFIGVGIMLRIKIDPRTVMTIQNQIPKVIICMILITFSYAISAFMIDLMWVSTYAGIDMITSSTPTINAGGEPLETKSTKQLLELPLIYVNGVFHTGGTGVTSSGIAHITNNVSFMVGDLLEIVIGNIFNVHRGDKCFKLRGPSKTPDLLQFVGGGIWYPVFSGIKNSIPHPGQCISDFLGYIANIVVLLIIFIILIVALFKTWFNLLKAYIYTLLYIIVSPIMIVFGLLPSKPMGFANWMKRLFVNIAVFPLTAFVIVGARVLMDVYDTHATANQFIPPLIGHNANLNFGSLLAFGALIMTPHLQTILQEKMGVKGIGSPGLVAAGIAGGAAVIGKPAGNAMKHLNRKDSAGQAVGALARFRKESGNKILDKASKSSINPFKDATTRRLETRKAIQNRSPHESEGRIRDAMANKDHPYWKEQGHEGQAPIPTWRQRRSNKKNGEGTPQTRRERRAARKNGAGGAGSTSTINVNIRALSDGHQGTKDFLNKPENSGKGGQIEQLFAQRAASTSLAGKSKSAWTPDEHAKAKEILDKIIGEMKA